MPGILSRAFDRFTTEQRDAADLRDDAERSGCCHIADTVERERVAIHGVVRWRPVPWRFGENSPIGKR